MKFKNFIIIAICLLSNHLFAQTIKGTIKNQAGELVPFTNISVLNSPVGTVADKEGTFSLNLSKGKYQLRFSAVGYANKVQNIEVSEKTITLNVALSDNNQSLDEVVQGNRIKKE